MTQKIVHISGVHPTDDETAIVDFAMKSCGESRSSTFGHHVKYFDDGVAVTIYTD